MVSLFYKLGAVDCQICHTWFTVCVHDHAGTKMKTLTIIGCGLVGKTLGKLFVSRELVRILQVLNRSQDSTQRAIEFLQQGSAAACFSDLEPADLILVSTSDGAIAQCASLLRESRAIHHGTIVFHCSGSQPSSLLAVLRQNGARIASVHPVKSFADPSSSVASFPGTYCGLEGDDEAVQFLTRIFEDCGGRTFPINPDFKLLYHAGTVIVCNYLTALLEAGLQCYEKAGIARPTAMALMQPIVEGTIANSFKLGPVKALTGPIARGEEELVRKQDKAIADWSSLISRVYRTMGTVAVNLSLIQGNASALSLQHIREILIASSEKAPPGNECAS